MLRIEVLSETFAERDIPKYEVSIEHVYAQNLFVKALFEPEMKWRLIEEYGIDSFKIQPDGRLLFQFGFYDKEYLFTWLLSFGDKVELLEPIELRKGFANLAERIKDKYKMEHDI